MKFFYDTEFIEDGPAVPIELISIGIVREDGQSLYLVNKDAPWNEIGQHDWLRENVVPSLPLVLTTSTSGTWSASWEATAPVYDRGTIAAAVRDFCIPPDHAKKIAGPTEMWGWYADYDHVLLSQLFGRMVDLPAGMPMYTRDLKQEVDLFIEEHRYTKGSVEDALRRADARCHGAEHNALEDALQLKARYEEFAALKKRLKLRR